MKEVSDETFETDVLQAEGPVRRDVGQTRHGREPARRARQARKGETKVKRVHGTATPLLAHPVASDFTAQ